MFSGGKTLLMNWQTALLISGIIGGILPHAENDIFLIKSLRELYLPNTDQFTEVSLKQVLQGVIWDLDGVIIDSMRIHYDSLIKVLQKYNCSISQHEFRGYFGRTNFEVLQEILGDQLTSGQIADLAKQKQKIFEDNAVDQAQLFQGVEQWLQYFQKLAIPQAVASSNAKKFIETIATRLNIRHYFNVLLSAEELTSKPDPLVFLESARLIGSAPRHSLVFEDALAGVEAARRAGMKCIAITTTNDLGALSQADLIIQHYDDLSPEKLYQVMN